MANDGTLNFDTKIDASGFNAGLDKLGNVAKTGIKATTTILTGAATALAGIGAASVKVGMEFEASMSQVAATMGITAETIAEDGTKPFDILSEAAKAAGESTQYSASEAAEALNYLALAGYDAATAADVLPSVLNLAAAGGMDLAYASDLATDAMSALGIEASNENLTNFGDKLAVTAQKSNTSVSQLGEAILTVSATAQNLAGGTTELNTALGILADSGIKGAEGGTHLRNVILSLTTASGDAATALDKYAGGVFDAEGNMRPLNEIMGDLNGNLAQMSQSDRINVINTIFNKTDLAAAQVLMAGCASSVEDLSAAFSSAEIDVSSFGVSIDELAESFDTSLTQEEYAAKVMSEYGVTAEQAGVMYSGFMSVLSDSGSRFDELSGYIDDSTGAMQGMADTMNDNLQGDLKILNSALEALGISIYESVDNPMRDVVQTATSMIGTLSDAFKEGGFDGMVNAIGDVLSQVVQQIAEAAPTLVNAAVSMVSSFCDGLKSAPGLADSGADLVMSIVTGISSCVGDIWTTAIVLIGKLADGIAAGAPEAVSAMATSIMDIVECIADWLPDILQAGVDIILAIVEGIAQSLPTLITQAANILIEICEAIVQNLPAIVEAALDIVQALIDGLISGIPLLLEGAIQLFMGIIEAIPVIIEQLLQALPELITSIINFFTENIPLIIDGAIQLLMGIIEAIPTIIQAIVENLPQIITALVEGLVGALPQLLDAAITLLMAIIKAIPEIVVAIAENLPEIITAIATGLAEAMPEIFTAAKDLLWNIITAIPEVVAGLATAVPDIIAGIVNGLVGGIGAVFDAAIELGGGILDGIKSFFGIHSPSTVMEEQGDYLVQGMINGLATLPDRAMEAINAVLDNIIAWGAEIAAQGVEVATTFVTNIVTAFAELPGQIWTWLTDVVNRVIQWGVNLQSQANTAVQTTINSIVTFFSELPGKIWTWLVNVVTNVTQWGINLLSAATTAVTTTINNIVTLFQSLPGKVWTWLVNVVNKVTEWGINLRNQAVSAVTTMINGIVDTLKSLPDKFVEVGKNCVTGIWNGISSGWDWLKEKVSSLAQSLLDSAKGALGINSPSTEFRDKVGKWLIPGIIEGVEDTLPDADVDIKAAAGHMTSTMQEEVKKGRTEATTGTVARATYNAVTNKAGDTYIEENNIDINNEFNCQTATPSEINKANRKAARDLLGGIKK